MTRSVRVVGLLLGWTLLGSSEQSSHGAASTRAVVHILQNGAAHCLGTIVTRGWVLTAKHCVQPLSVWKPHPTVFAVERDGERFPIVEVVTLGGAYNHLGDLRGRDLALVRVEHDWKLDTCMALGDPPPELWAIIDRGRLEIASADLVLNDRKSLYTTAPTKVGDSGGPLFSEDGCALGVASWRTRPPASSRLAAYTRLSAHSGWIDEVVTNRVAMERTAP